ncbi:MAG: hypothetical protein ACKORE_03635, partial [Bacteroidota bacterium]
VNFGISNTSTATYGATNFSKNTTYLIIVKHSIVTGTTADPLSMWVIPSGMPASETAAGTAEVTNTTTNGTDAISAVGLRQGSNTTSTRVVVDAIRVGSSWGDVMPLSSVPLSASSTSGTIACAGGSTTVTVSASGGLPPYTGTGTFTVQAGAYSYTVTDANGNTAVASGSISDGAAVTSNTTTATACGSYTWSVNGVTYTQSGTYSLVSGCNTAVLSLTVTPATTNTTTVAACDSYYWGANGNHYTQSGVYSYSISPNPLYPISYTVAVAEKDATHPNFGIGSPNGYVLNGVQGQVLTLERGVTYKFYFDGQGTCCSSTLGHPFVFTTNSVGGGANSGDVITSGVIQYGDSTYFTPGSSTPSLIYYMCDVHASMGSQINIVDPAPSCHTEILNLTVTPATSNSTAASACDNYTWSVNGVSYTQSGTYTATIGCATEELSLTISPSTTNTTTASACDTYTWSVNGNTYTQSGIYS